MCKFMFWNVGKLGNKKLVADCCVAHGVDVLLTAEDSLSDLEQIVGEKPLEFVRHFNPNKQGLCFYSKRSLTLVPVFDEGHFSIKILDIDNIGKVIVMLVHFPSKLHANEDGQCSFVTNKVNTLLSLERQHGINKTVVVGDFNINPHEKGMLRADALNAVACKNIARKEYRVKYDKQYGFFYNPMWQFYTSSQGVGSGTYYSNPVDYPSIYWNIFDQVIVRPSLVDNLGEVCIVNSLSGRNLVTSGRNRDADHLPIVFSLK